MRLEQESKKQAGEQTGHTPGPWFVKPGTSVFYIACHKGYLAKTTGDATEDQSNARLIAAAPIMYEAIKQTLDMEQPELPSHIVLLLSKALNSADGGK